MCQSKTAFFGLSFLSSRKRAFSTQLFSTENSGWRIQSKNSTFSTGSSSQSENSVEKVLHVFFEPIASPIPPPNTHPHGHTATHPYQVPYCRIIQGADAGLAISTVASRSKSAWRIPSSAHQQRVTHDGSSARSRSHAANNGCACCSLIGSRLSATSRMNVALSAFG